MGKNGTTEYPRTLTYGRSTFLIVEIHDRLRNDSESLFGCRVNLNNTTIILQRRYDAVERGDRARPYRLPIRKYGRRKATVLTMSRRRRHEINKSIWVNVNYGDGVFMKTEGNGLYVNTFAVHVCSWSPKSLYSFHSSVHGYSSCGINQADS